MRIFAPLVKTNTEGDKELVGFETASVFDVAQTEGEELPEPPLPELLTDDPRIPGLLASLETFARANGNRVEYIPLTGSCRGFFEPATGDVMIGDNLPPLATLATLIHEIAHSLAHGGNNTSRSVAELEAESCAFPVCDARGLDTSRSSFAYLAHWTDHPEQVLPAAQLSDRILEALNEPRPVPPEAHGVRSTCCTLSRPTATPCTTPATPRTATPYGGWPSTRAARAARSFTPRSGRAVR